MALSVLDIKRRRQQPGASASASIDPNAPLSSSARPRGEIAAPPPSATPPFTSTLPSFDRTTGQGLSDREQRGIAPVPTEADKAKLSASSSRWDPGLKAQMDAIGAKYGRVWRDDEYDQWIGSSGYIMKDDINGSGAALPAWAGGDIDPYWQSRMAMHATGDYYGNGTTPGDANSNRAGGGSFPSFMPPASSPSTGGAGGGLPAPAAPGVNSALYQQMIDRLLNTPQDVDAAALADSPENQAYTLGAQRSEERMRAQMAERAAMTGQSNSGGFDTALQGVRQDRAFGEAGFLGDLAIQKLEANRAALIQGIQFAMADAQFDKAQQLEERLSSLNAAIERERMSLGAAEGAAARALQRELGLLGIGYNYDALQATLNQQATSAMLDGYGY